MVKSSGSNKIDGFYYNIHNILESNEVRRQVLFVDNAMKDYQIINIKVIFDLRYIDVIYCLFGCKKIVRTRGGFMFMDLDAKNVATNDNT